MNLFVEVLRAMKYISDLSESVAGSVNQAIRMEEFEDGLRRRVLHEGASTIVGTALSPGLIPILS